MIETLNGIIAASPAKLADIHRYREQWKRLGERLHPHEYPQCAYANDMFVLVRGHKKVATLAAKIEHAFQIKDTKNAIMLLALNPGLFVRSVDRLLRLLSEQEHEAFLEVAQKCFGQTAGRVLLSLREHLQNRTGLNLNSKRIFSNKKGSAWVTEETRAQLDENLIGKVLAIIDFELQKRVPQVKKLVIDPAILSCALPLSEKNKLDGFAIMPRGSTMPVENGITRFFVYWKQKSSRTDYDLSLILLGKDLGMVGQASYTNLRSIGSVHSGDLTDATNGATEFIDVDFSYAGSACYAIPTINIFVGEDFTEVESCFFGFMSRTKKQQGKPFEPATVKTKSDIRGTGKIALPIAFMKNEDGSWQAKWMHLYQKGMPNFNGVETNHLTASILMQSIVGHQYLMVQYLVDLISKNAEQVVLYEDGMELSGEPITYIGLERVEGLSDGSTVYTLNNLREIIPA
jgi:hypothetical protein